MHRSVIALALVALISLFKVSGTALTYQVASYENACFYEDVQTPNKKIFFYYDSQSGETDVTVYDPQQRILHKSSAQTNGDHVFDATTLGVYSFCFTPPGPRVIDFDVSIEEQHATAPGQTSNKKDAALVVTPLEESLNKLELDLMHIMRTQKYFRAREHRNQGTVESTESRIFFFAVLESALIVGMAVVQVYVVRAFFKNQKARI